MSEETKKRTVEDVHREYSQSCADAGHIQYRMALLEDDLRTLEEQLNELNRKRKDLNLEAVAIQGRAAEEAKNAQAS